MPLSSKVKARRGLTVFFALLIVSSAFLEHSRALAEAFGSHFISVYMWLVAGSSIVARLVLRESPGDISFRWNGWLTTRAIILGTLMPLAVGIFTYGLYWSTGLGSLSFRPAPSMAYGISITGASIPRFCKFLLINLTVGTLWSCKSSAGEEIGWRGYMLTRLQDSGFRMPILVSGLVWGLWHVPLILGGRYTSVPASFLSVTVFISDITALGYVLAWMRLSSGSIWPCIWVHAVWNQMIIETFGGIASGGQNWVGEAGVLTALAVTLFAVCLYRFWPLDTSKQPLQFSPAQFAGPVPDGS